MLRVSRALELHIGLRIELRVELRAELLQSFGRAPCRALIELLYIDFVFRLVFKGLINEFV